MNAIEIMGESVLSSCSDECGWVAAIICVIAFGSFGVPIKTGVKVEVHPVVMQTYKTAVLFATCWFVILLGEEVRWSNWGIISGIFWVPGATCGIYGIRNAGLAIAVGTWSSIMVVSSLIFGIIIFEEKVKSFAQTLGAFFVLFIGLIGMSRYAAPTASPSSTVMMKQQHYRDRHKDERHVIKNTKSNVSTRSIAQKNKKSVSKGNKDKNMTKKSRLKVKKDTESSSSHGDIENSDGDGINESRKGIKRSKMSSLETEPLLPYNTNGSDSDSSNTMDLYSYDDSMKNERDRLLILFGGRIILTKRQLGILGAAVNGAWGGLSLIPVHYARRDDGLTGAAFVISYAGGAVIVQTCVWILLFLYHLYCKNCVMVDALKALPKFHFKYLWRPGLYAGLLYSIGNFSSILAVSYLGQGIGFTFCQLQLLVSGLWGVFYFREIKGFHNIMKWFASATISVIGIIWLSRQH